MTPPYDDPLGGGPGFPFGPPGGGGGPDRGPQGPGGYGPGGGPPPGPGGPGRGLDPFLDQGVGSSIDGGRRRIARETYWNLRRYSRSTRAFVMEQFQGGKNNARRQEMYLLAEAVDLLVNQAWEFGGTPCVDATLEARG